MTNFLARAAAVVATSLLATSLVQAQGTSAQAAPPKPPDQKSWSVEIYPLLAYVPLAGIDTRLPEAPPCTGCPPSAPSDSESGLSGAWFAAFRAEKGRLALAGDINYAGLSAERTSPFYDASVRVIAGSASVGVKLVEGLYVEGGARYYELDVTATILSYPEVSWKPNTFQPMIGTSYRPQLGRHFRIDAHLDYAGFGGDANTVNGYARLEWRALRHLALVGGYGFSRLHVDGTIRDKPISLTYTLHGPIVGFGIPF